MMRQRNRRQLSRRPNSGRSLTHLSTRIFNTPLMIHPRKADVILSVLGPRLGLAPQSLPVVVTREDEYDDGPDDYDYSEKGIAVIPVFGTLVKRASGLDAESGLTSYEELTAQIRDTMADPQVQGIIFNIDSPGGEASMFDLADMIYNLRGVKPMISVANDSMYSAAYALGSSADVIFVSREGGCGSIGCYMLHVNQAGMDQQAGLEYEYIFAGDGKTAGNQHEPLDKDTRAELQAQVDKMRDMFVDLVARNRNRSTRDILDLQAHCFNGTDALPLLADKVGGVNEALWDMASILGSAPSRSARFIPRISLPATQRLDQDELNGLYATAFGAGRLGCAEMALSHATSMERFGTPGAVLAVRSLAQCRSSAPAGAGRKILLLVAPYDGSTCNLGGGLFERYDRGCFSQGLNGDPLAVLINHNEEKILGLKSAGTAHFWEDFAGVHAEADVPNTTYANDLLENMRRGECNQCSAAFWILQQRWETQGDKKVRVVEKAVLRDASVLAFAAYRNTSATIEQLPAAASQVQNGLEAARRRLAAATLPSKVLSDLDRARQQLDALR